MWESGYMDCLSKYVRPEFYWGCIGLATDIRLQTLPDVNKPGADNQTMYLNQFVIGGLKYSLGVFGLCTILIALKVVYYIWFYFIRKN
jgi:hypothetical protein